MHAECRWTEGWAYFPVDRYLVFSDIPSNQLLRPRPDHLAEDGRV